MLILQLSINFRDYFRMIREEAIPNLFFKNVSTILKHFPIDEPEDTSTKVELSYQSEGKNKNRKNTQNNDQRGINNFGNFVF